jgi:hypothetical protein
MVNTGSRFFGAHMMAVVRSRADGRSKSPSPCGSGPECLEISESGLILYGPVQDGKFSLQMEGQEPLI